MPPCPPRGATRAVSIALVYALGTLILAPFASASDGRGSDPHTVAVKACVSDPSTSPASPEAGSRGDTVATNGGVANRETNAIALRAPEAMALRPVQSPALIGLVIAQMAAQSAAAPAATQRALSDAAKALPAPSQRARGLVALYASYVALQAFDVHSTLTATSGSGIERNPVVAPFVNRPGAFLALKAASTAGAIIAADRLSKHNRVAAYALMFALNSAYAIVVVHNYRIAGR